jgi:hypothetical protein
VGFSPPARVARPGAQHRAGRASDKNRHRSALKRNGTSSSKPAIVNAVEERYPDGESGWTRFLSLRDPAPSGWATRPGFGLAEADPTPRTQALSFLWQTLQRTRRLTSVPHLGQRFCLSFLTYGVRGRKTMIAFLPVGVRE